MRVRAFLGRRWIVGVMVVLSLGFVGVARAQANAQIDCTTGTTTGNHSITAGSTTAISGTCTMSGSVPATATVTFDDVAVTVDDGSSNAGTLDFVDDNSAFTTTIGGTFTNLAGGVIDDQTTSNGQRFYARNFLNYGTIESTGNGSPNTSDMVFDDSAASGNDTVTDNLENEPGGTISVAPGDQIDVEQGMNLKLDAGSTSVNSNSGPVNTSHSGRIYLAGVGLELNGGNISGILQLGSSTATFDASAGSSTGTIDVTGTSGLAGTIPPGYTLDLDGGASLNTAAGSANDGTMVVDYNQGFGMNLPTGATFTNAGTLDLQALSSLTTNGGGIALTPGSVLELGDNGPRTIGQLYGNGPVALGGTLSVVDGNGYTPAVGDSQNIVFGVPVSGQFGSIQGGSGSAPYSVSYGSSVATLVAGASAAAAPIAAPTTPTASPAPTSPAGSAVSVTRPKVTKGAVELSIGCSAGPGCATQTITATATEKVKGRHGRTKSKRVVVASANVTPGAGEASTVTLKLNAAGRHLLASRHRLALTVTVTSSGKVTHSYEVTVTAAKKRSGHR